MTNSGKPSHGLLIDAGVVVVVLVLGSWLLQPGVFVVDESHYLLATRAMATEGSFRIENGYESLQDPRLLYFYAVIPDKVAELGAVSTVPPYHALLATPFFLAGGITGMILLNLLAFAACLVAVRRIAARLRPEPAYPLAVTLVFALGGFSLEYALGVWPHSVSQSLVAWSLLVLLAATDSSDRRVWLFGLAGLLGGIATGVRIQNIILLVILLPAARIWLRLAWPRLAALATGWLLPVVGLSLINLHRLADPNPFTNGLQRTLEQTLPWQVLAVFGAHPWIIAVLAASVLAGIWLYKKNRLRWLWAAAAVAGVAVVVSLPAARTLAGRWIASVGFHLVDSALIPGGQGSTGAHLNELGQVLYGGVLKKGLLEALPWLSLSVLILACGWLRRSPPRALRFLSAVGLLGLGLIPVVLSRGGMSYNPRYLLELLAPLTLVSLYWAFELRPGRRDLLAGMAGGVLAALPVLLHPGRVDLPAGGWLPMLLPLGLAAALVAGAVVTLRLDPNGRGLAARLTALVLAAALTYGALVHLRVDVTTSLNVRHVASRMLQESREVVPDKPAPSVLLAWEARKDVFTPLKHDRDVWIGALRRWDDDAPTFIDAVLGQRRVFVLRNGIPADRFARWFDHYRTSTEVRAGLEFVELLGKKEPP